MPARPSQSRRCSPIADQSEPSQSNRADHPVSSDDQRQNLQMQEFLDLSDAAPCSPRFQSPSQGIKNNAPSPCLSAHRSQYNSSAAFSSHLGGAARFRTRLTRADLTSPRDQR